MRSGYLPDLITQRATRFLDDQTPDHPFFLVVSQFNPHLPYEGHPQKYYDMYANRSSTASAGSRRRRTPSEIASI